jgi:excisionase family DNA binding protein
MGLLQRCQLLPLIAVRCGRDLLHMLHLRRLIDWSRSSGDPHARSPTTSTLRTGPAAVARGSGQLLSRYAHRKHSLTLLVQEAGQDKPIELPAGAVALLIHILEAMGAGRGLTLIPENEELTTFEAADVVKVSRPYLIKLFEEGAIAYRKVGKHRRIRMEDVMAYKERHDRERDAILDQLVREAQEQDMGYGRR